MTNFFATTGQAVNLLFNGNFDCEPTGFLHFWSVFTAKKELSLGSELQLIKDEQVDTIKPFNRLKLVISEDETVFMVQHFEIKEPAFSLQPQTITQGYKISQYKTFDTGFYSIGFSVQVLKGSATMQPVALDKNGNELPLSYSTSVSISQSATWSRFVLTFKGRTDISSLGFKFNKTPSQGLLEIELGLIQLISGQYSSVPFNGDPFADSIPRGAILLSEGELCPPGFYELGNGDLNPLSEWLVDDPSVQARVGNFPRSGTALTGSETHTNPDVAFKPGEVDKTDFVGFKSKEVLESTNYGTGINNNPDVDVPGGPNGIPDHKHSLEAAGTRPVSRAFLFCVRA